MTSIALLILLTLRLRTAISSDWVFCFFRGGCLKLEGVERFILKKMEIEFLLFQHFYSLCLEAFSERFEPEPEVGQVILGATCGSAAQPFWLFQEKCFLSVSLALLIYKQRFAEAGTPPQAPLALRAVLFPFFYLYAPPVILSVVI